MVGGREYSPGSGKSFVKRITNIYTPDWMDGCKESRKVGGVSQHDNTHSSDVSVCVCV